MLAIETWCKGKPDLLALSAINLATTANSLYTLLSKLQSKSLFLEKVPQPKLKEWVSYYKQHRKLTAAWFSCLEIPEYLKDMTKPQKLRNGGFDDLLVLKDVEGVEKKLHLLARDEPVVPTIKNTRRTAAIKRLALKEYRRELHQPQPEANLDAWLDLISDPSIYFALKVLMPCWLCYRTLPGHLLRRARLGDLESLDKIMRIDSSIVYEPKIAELMHQLRINKPSAHEQLTEALNKKPKTAITPRRIKTCLSGFLVLQSALFQHRLTPKEIRDLFDAIAKDQDLGEIDTDIPDSPEAFKRALQREMPLWAPIFGFMPQG